MRASSAASSSLIGASTGVRRVHLGALHGLLDCLKLLGDGLRLGGRLGDWLGMAL